VAELARTHRRQLARRAGDRRAGIVLRREGEEVMLETLVVAHQDLLAVILERRRGVPQVLPGLIERHRAAQLPGTMGEAERLPGGRGDELERVGLVVGLLAHRQPELQAVAAGCRRDVGHAQADVIDPAQPDHDSGPAPRSQRLIL
jgi:hypothetical protein